MFVHWSTLTKLRKRCMVLNAHAQEQKKILHQRNPTHEPWTIVSATESASASATLGS